ncbi:hypothetical protein SPAN111604_15150 [Sphingomonas antarctica]
MQLPARFNTLAPSVREALTGDLVEVRGLSRRALVTDRSMLSNDVILILDGWAFSYIAFASGARQITAIHLPGDLLFPRAAGSGDSEYGTCAVSNLLIGTLPDALVGAGTALENIVQDARVQNAAILEAWLANMGRRDAYARTAHLLCEMHTRAILAGLTANATFQMPLFQEDLGDILGLTPVHINRMMRRLREGQVAKVGFGRVDILNLENLMAIGSFDDHYLHPAGGQERGCCQTNGAAASRCV